MWCKVCQQDTPALAFGEEGKLRCLRCSGIFNAEAGGKGSAAPSGGQPDASTHGVAGVSPAFDGWELDERLRQIERALQLGRVTRTGQPDRQSTYRLDAAHDGPREWHLPQLQQRRTRGHASENTRRRTFRDWSMAFLVWSSLSLGVMLLACGGILLGWSVWAGRPELWSIGLPIAIGGQIGLVLGLVLQLDRLWHHNRRQAVKLDNVDEQLSDLKSATALLSTTHSAPATAFYSHFASGASPHILLADLKGQLDLLAVKLGQVDR